MQTWDYGEGRAALHSEDSAVWEAARKAGLKQAGEYRRKDGVLFARQFVGDKEKVRALIREIGDREIGKGVKA
ncbi:MAG: hypothetical protein HPY89_00485 [Pelotomaculum sp.]|nr:hypothetical protein [Pelotomaculum sp.]